MTYFSKKRNFQFEIGKVIQNFSNSGTQKRFRSFLCGKDLQVMPLRINFNRKYHSIH